MKLLHCDIWREDSNDAQKEFRFGNNCNDEVWSYCTVTFDAKTPMTPRKSSALETIAMVNRHGLMLLWLKDLINVTEKLQFIDPTILLYTQKGPLVAAFRSPLMKALDRYRNVGSLKPNHVWLSTWLPCEL